MLKFKYILIIAFAILGLLLVSEPFVYVSFLWYILLFLVTFGIILIGSFSMSWSLFLRAFTSNPNVKDKKIAITFDDGPNPQFTSKVLQLLAEYEAKATFFCIGKHVKKYPEILKLITSKGHDIGNHSYSHSNTIDFKSTESWLMEIKTTDHAIFNVTSNKPTLFRPPFGVTTPHLAKALKVTGHKVIGWNNRPFDTSTKNHQRILKRLLKKIQPGAIILLHDNHNRVEVVLEQLLQFLKTNDYKMVTVKELLDEK